MSVNGGFPHPDEYWMRHAPAHHPMMCKKCGEERMVNEIFDYRGIQAYCSVCSHSWWVIGKDKPWPRCDGQQQS